MKSIVLRTSCAILLGVLPAVIASAQSAGHDFKKAGKAVGHGVVKTGKTVKDKTDKVVHKSSHNGDQGASRTKNKTKQ